MAGSAVHATARVYLVLGLAAACFAIYAISLDPATFRQLQLQMTKEAGPHTPEQGQMECAATAAETMQMRADAVVLLLLGAAQALMAMAAIAGTSPFRTFLSLLVSIPMAWRLTVVFAGVVHVALGRCHHYDYEYDSYHQLLLVLGYASVAVSFDLLSISGLVVALCGKVNG